MVSSGTMNEVTRDEKDSKHKCPFCGWKDSVLRFKWQAHQKVWFAFCNCCEAQGPVSVSEDKAESEWGRSCRL